MIFIEEVNKHKNEVAVQKNTAEENNKHSIESKIIGSVPK
jgi:hypothetical protein